MGLRGRKGEGEEGKGGGCPFSLSRPGNPSCKTV